MSALGGRRVLVTRRGEQSRPLVDALARRGATVVEVPLVAYEPPEDPRPLDGALDRLPSYDWIAFTSANAVGAVADRLAQRGLELPLRVRLAAVGAATGDAIAARFPSRRAELQPEAVFRAEGLVAAFGALPAAPRRVLLPVSDRARDTLAAGLRALGAQADVVVAYRTLAAAGAREGLERALADGVDLVLLASPSAVEALQQALGERARGLPAAVIGPVTEACARDAGLDVKVVARSATADDLAAAAERCFAEPSRSG